MTICRMTICRMTICRVTIGRMTIGRMTTGRMTICRMTTCRMTRSRMTICRMDCMWTRRTDGMWTRRVDGMWTRRMDGMWTRTTKCQTTICEMIIWQMRWQTICQNRVAGPLLMTMMDCIECNSMQSIISFAFNCLCSTILSPSVNANPYYHLRVFGFWIHRQVLNYPCPMVLKPIFG